MSAALPAGSRPIADSTTKERILDAAERLFARQDVGATSLRAVTAEAGVNTAAIHYHFGSREALVEALLMRRLAPLEQERRKRLDRLEAAVSDGALPPEALLDAFLRPVFEMRAALGERARALSHLLVWLRVSGDPETGDRMALPFEEVRGRFAEAACRGRDDLEPEEAAERLEYALGATIQVLLRAGEDGLQTDPAELHRRLDRMVAFLAPGLAQPGGAAWEKPS